jgi:hypothetical protein
MRSILAPTSEWWHLQVHGTPALYLTTSPCHTPPPSAPCRTYCEALTYSVGGKAQDPNGVRVSDEYRQEKTCSSVMAGCAATQCLLC